MAEDTRSEDEKPDAASEGALSARLKQLGDRLDHLGPGRSVKYEASPRPRADMSGFARGMRLSAELVGGVVVGVLLGWLIDRWLGTSPWGMIIFLMLGFAAGVLNVMRSAGVIQPGPKL